ncbi:Metal tolerance protein 1 [Hondaea fermentalgiana]|uniref:Metal tolerance protein 1 n=1 Tax=Hondaea fermentalgiana TaxID=2315210 RepID=A0A2R5GZ12_9STRA|nr:Metal tolerance protein 1 [Hondaea fermentalgiana]|eukprot:GBG33711.1 Metal tolerance protein 1 [Hondaea fermentalgiana]
MGGFRRLYPRADGARFDTLIDHLKTKFPGDVNEGSFRVHRSVSRGFISALHNVARQSAKLEDMNSSRDTDASRSAGEREVCARKSLNPFDSDASAEPSESGSDPEGLLSPGSEDDFGAWTHVGKAGESPVEEDLEEDAEETEVKGAEREEQYDDILRRSAALFGGFAILQLIAALASQSLALLSDAASMLVDTMSYGLNLYAEQRKRKQRLSALDLVRLEVFVPLFSAACLTFILIAVCWAALADLAQPQSPGGKTVREGWPLIFASANLAIDLVCTWRFLRRAQGNPLEFVMSSSTSQGRSWIEDSSPRNVNMCSAWTHIIADTLRSITVLCASLLAGLHPNWNSNRVDSFAALVVSAIIFMVTIPLLVSAWRKYGVLLDSWRDSIHADSADESKGMLSS